MRPALHRGGRIRSEAIMVIQETWTRAARSGSKGEKGTDLTGPWELELTDGGYGGEGGKREGRGTWGCLAGVQLGQLVEGDTLH